MFSTIKDKAILEKGTREERIDLIKKKLAQEHSVLRASSDINRIRYAQGAVQVLDAMLIVLG